MNATLGDHDAALLCLIGGDLFAATSLLTELGTTHAGKGLARRATDQNIDLIVSGAL